jgi:hypothetical protein
VLIAVLAALALAAPADTGKHVFLTVGAGLISTSGNTEFTTFDVGNKLVIVAGPWKFTQTAGLTYAKNDDSLTAELWRGSLRGERSVSSRIGLYGLVELDRNVFAGIRSRVSPSLGVSALAAAAERDTLRLELGAGYVTEKAVPPGLDRSYGGGRFAGIYRHRFGAKSIIDQTVEYFPNFKTSADYRIASFTSISAPITSGIALKATYLIHTEGVPQPGFKKTDRTLSMGIQLTL